MPNKHFSQSIVPPVVDSIEAVDVGENSNSYANDADRQAVHHVYELGNEVAAEKNEPVFDNRVGFTSQLNIKKPASGPAQVTSPLQSSAKKL